MSHPFRLNADASRKNRLAEELDGKTQRREYRDEDTYPYKSHFQYLRAAYACFGCFLFIFFNGWQSFLGGLSSGPFLTAYISVRFLFSTSSFLNCYTLTPYVLSNITNTVRDSPSRFSSSSSLWSVIKP